MPEPTINSRSLPNDLPPDRLLLRPEDDFGHVGLDPKRAGWRYLSYVVHDFHSSRRSIVSIVPAPGEETCVVVQAGRDVVIADEDGGRWELPGRESVFDDLPSAIWLPDGRQLTIEVRRPPARRMSIFAVARAPRSSRDGVATDPIVVRPADVVVEIRGAGNASRQINHIVAPTFPADRLEVVEVLTPSGNWSSWPPHKHDVDDMPGEAVLEEIYHYRFRRPEAWAIQRVYRADRTRDAIWEVRDGDVVIVPDGYHPFTAAHGDDAYYLNALAGDRRTMACSFDPELDWVRETWATMEADPRLPLVPPVGAGTGVPA
ncbi:MAG TPA: 5-deoxy-glucuronate isomerase [Candidatus Limnocylindrales bacterium]|nr:5-deoxy-glucuronate isomerase [Candidatus Limnocylindrales bacterium]